MINNALVLSDAYRLRQRLFTTKIEFVVYPTIGVNIPMELRENTAHKIEPVSFFFFFNNELQNFIFERVVRF